MPDITLEHALDASYLISLWLAVHGGDPGPERILSKAEVAAVASKVIATLEPFAQAASLEQIAAVKLSVKGGEQVVSRLRELGIDGHTHDGGKRVELRLPTLTPHQPVCWCFGPPGHQICFCVPVPREPSL